MSATRIWETTIHYSVETRGFGGSGAPGVDSPKLAWTIGGVGIATTGAGSTHVTTPDGAFAVKYDMDLTTGRLKLVAAGGERYSVALVVTATEPGGGDGVTARSDRHVGVTAPKWGVSCGVLY